jgi:light-regulated signal transduction histidine kinase (bacteriophytochrome)
VNRALNESNEIKERKCTEEKMKFLTNEFILLTTALSHDLRAPVRIMDGYLEMLWDDHCKELNQEGVRVYNLVKQNNKHLKSLMDYLLEFSRLAIREIKKSPVDVKNVVEELIEETNQTVDHNAKFIIGNLNPIKADHTLMYIMFMHLISNAIKYSAKNPNPIIEIYSEEKKDQIVYIVKDNGVGFDMQYVHKLFGTFQKLHEPGEYDGTGMGLAIVQRIVNKHYGKVWAESTVGEGATLFCAFPKEME